MGQRQWQWRGVRTSLLLLGVLLGSITICGVLPARAATVQSSTDPSLTFGPSYAGFDMGQPQGPVGGISSLAGQNLKKVGFNSGATLAVYILPVASAPNTTSPSPTATCTTASGTISVGTTQLKGDNNGSFSTSFTWPTTARKSTSALWAACIVDQSSPSTFAYSSTSTGTSGPGLFAVQTDAAPTLTVAPNALRPGETLTISGQNWLPAHNSPDLQITLVVGICSSTSTLATQTFAASGDGTFSRTVMIPANTDARTYQVCAATANRAIAFDASSGPVFQVLTVAPTATAAPSPTAQPTATPAPTATTITNQPPTSSPGGGNGVSNQTLALLGGAVVLLLLLGGGLLLYAISHQPPRGPAGPQGSPRSPSGPTPGYPQQPQQPEIDWRASPDLPGVYSPHANPGDPAATNPGPDVSQNTVPNQPQVRPGTPPPPPRRSGPYDGN